MLSPLLARAYIMRGGDRMLRMGYREVKVAPGFRLITTTRMSAPPPHHDDMPELLQAKIEVSALHAASFPSQEWTQMRTFVHHVRLHAHKPGVHLAGMPDVAAEVARQVAIIDCAVTAAGVTAQLAGMVVRTEQPALAAQLMTFRADTHAQHKLQVNSMHLVTEETSVQCVSSAYQCFWYVLDASDRGVRF